MRNQTTGLSVGIGSTNDCNLRCPHCYRDTQQVVHLSLEQIKVICECLPVAAVGFGTGENALNPEFAPIVEYLHGRGVKLSLASNGFSLLALSEDHLRAFHDVEVSIDFPSAKEQDAFRGEGNWALVHWAVERCRRLGVSVSILATLMSVNCHKLDALVDLARSQGTTLRVNAYQPVKTDRFKLSYEQFWSAYRTLFHSARVISCTEPVVRAAINLGDARSPCGHTSVRINQVGQIIPCVYWPPGEGAATVADLPRLGVRVLDLDDLRRARSVPEVARECRCQGGCASRRMLGGRLDAHDEYCPWARGEEMRLDWRAAPATDLTRAGNVCTTIVAP